MTTAVSHTDPMTAREAMQDELLSALRAGADRAAALSINLARKGELRDAEYHAGRQAAFLSAMHLVREV